MLDKIKRKVKLYLRFGQRNSGSDFPPNIEMGYNSFVESQDQNTYRNYQKIIHKDKFTTTGTNSDILYIKKNIRRFSPKILNDRDSEK